MHTEAASHDRLRVALQHLKLRLIAVAPKPDIKSAAADVKIEQRQVDIQFSVRRVRYDPQDRLHKREDRPGGPSLRHIRSKILHRKALFVTLDRCVEFG